MMRLLCCFLTRTFHLILSCSVPDRFAVLFSVWGLSFSSSSLFSPLSTVWFWWVPPLTSLLRLTLHSGQWTLLRFRHSRHDPSWFQSFLRDHCHWLPFLSTFSRSRWRSPGFCPVPCPPHSLQAAPCHWSLSVLAFIFSPQQTTTQLSTDRNSLLQQ